MKNLKLRKKQKRGRGRPRLPVWKKRQRFWCWFSPDGLEGARRLSDRLTAEAGHDVRKTFVAEVAILYCCHCLEAGLISEGELLRYR